MKVMQVGNWLKIHHTFYSLRKTVGKVSPILVTLTSRSDSDFKQSNVSLKENKPDGVSPNSNEIDHYVRKNEGKIRWLSADCIQVWAWYKFWFGIILFLCF